MDGIVVVCGQPAAWKTMVQLAVWIGAAGATAVAVATTAGELVGWMLSDGEENVTVAEDVAFADDGAVANDPCRLLTQLGTSVG